LLKNVDLNGIVLLSADPQLRQFSGRTALEPWRGPALRTGHGFLLSQATRTAARPAPVSSGSESFALGEYSTALLAGSLLAEDQKRRVAEKLHQYTGLPVDYILKSNLRVAGGAFSKNLQDADGITTGRIDTRYRGPDLNRLSEEAEYDPRASAISAAYPTAINDYLRRELKFVKEETYKPNKAKYL
jgi:carboxypeptidase C (cathepsin A)